MPTITACPLVSSSKNKPCQFSLVQLRRSVCAYTLKRRPLSFVSFSHWIRQIIHRFIRLQFSWNYNSIADILATAASKFLSYRLRRL